MPMQYRDSISEEPIGGAKRARMGDLVPSETEILRLVAQRESYRQTRRFAESDSIREELRALGVEVYDKEKEWRARDGRRGTLFTAGPEECRLSDQEIQDRIVEREEARRARDFERSDVLRDELRQMGVEMNDKDASWKTSGGRAGTYSGGPSQQSLPGTVIQKLIAERERLRSAQDFFAADELRAKLAQSGVEIYDNERIWRTSDGQQGVIVTGGHDVSCTLSDEEISMRVSSREEARSAKNWEDADWIRDELRRLGVELLDNQRMWCTTDGRSGSYTGGVSQQSFTTQWPEVRQSKVAATAAAAQAGALKPGRDSAAFAAAQAVAGLALLAQQQQSTRGTPHLPLMVLGQAQGPAQGATGPTFSDASIAALVAGREKAREKHDWSSADAIRSDLRSHGVEVWDKDKVWRSSDGRSGSMGN